MSKYYLPLEKNCVQLRHVLEWAMDMQAECHRALAKGDEEDHKGALWLSTQLISKNNMVLQELQKIMGEEDDNSNETSNGRDDAECDVEHGTDQPSADEDGEQEISSTRPD